MKLEPRNRTIEGQLFLNEIIADYKNIFETSLVNDFEIDNKLFKYEVEKDPKVVVNSMFSPSSPKLKLLTSYGNTNATI